MKTKFFAIAALAATTMFSSCKQDKVTFEEGEATTMKVSINFPTAPQTRASLDPNVQGNEADLRTVDIFIYYASGSFQSHTRLAATDFSANPTQGTNSDVYAYIATTGIPTTTGSKLVFAGINLPTTVRDALTNSPMSTLTSVAQTMSRSELTGTNGFVMFSTAATSATFAKDENDPANKVTVRCERLVAKVTVETAVNMEKTGVPGDIQNLMFAVNNFNTKFFMLQGVAPERRDPNWVMDPTNNFYVGDFSQAVEADYANIRRRVSGDNDLISNYIPSYASENTTESKIKGEATRVTVRGGFIPTQVFTYTGGVLTQIANPNTTPTTFYFVRPSITEGDFCFNNQAQAEAFAASRGGATVVTYTGGMCYWDIFLGKNPINPINKWDVLRNDFYKCNIRRINTPGRNLPELPETEKPKPIEDETNITADIEILFWHTPVLSDYDLE